MDGLNKLKEQAKEEKNKMTVAEIYNNSREISRYYSQKTINVFLRYLPEILMILLSSTLIGIQQFADANWNWRAIFEATFWYEYIPYVMALWIVLISAINGKIKYLLVNDLMYLDLNETIQKYIDNDTNGEITKIANKEDRERKIKKYIEKKSYELEKNLKKYNINTIQVLEVYLGLKTLDYLNVETDENQTKLNLLMLNGIKIPKRKENLIKTKLLGLYNELQHDYIEKNIDNIKIKYNRVTYTILTNGKTKSNNYDGDTTLKENLGVEIFSEFGVFQFIMMGAMVFWLAMELTLKEPSMETVIRFGTKLLMLVWNYIQASFRTPIIFKNTYIRATRERLQILQKTNIKI